MVDVRKRRTYEALHRVAAVATKMQLQSGRGFQKKSSTTLRSHHRQMVDVRKRRTYEALHRVDAVATKRHWLRVETTRGSLQMIGAELVIDPLQAADWL